MPRTHLHANSKPSYATTHASRPRTVRRRCRVCDIGNGCVPGHDAVAPDFGLERDIGGRRIPVSRLSGHQGGGLAFAFRGQARTTIRLITIDTHGSATPTTFTCRHPRHG